MRLLGLAAVLGLALAGLLHGLALAYLVHAPRAEAALRRILRDEAVLQRVREQNAQHRPLDDSALRARDGAWIAERAAGGGPLIAGMLAEPASQALQAYVAASRGAVRHAIVMDARGLNAAIAAPTSDAFQGDEPKHQATFGRPPGTRHVGSPERGHTGDFVACWLSVPLHDPATGEPIGAVSLELDAALVRGALCGR